MNFDHSKLLGRIVEKFGSQRALASAIGWTESKLSARLNNSVNFDSEEIMLLSAPDVLDIPCEEFPAYFFTV
jgi:hypothetical protein